MITNINEQFYKSLKRENFEIYSDQIFLSELLRIFKPLKYEVFFYFEKGKVKLIFPKGKETDLFQNEIERIKTEIKKYKQGLVPIDFDYDLLSFIREVKINYFYYGGYSKNIWIHYSDCKFIHEKRSKKLTKENWTHLKYKTTQKYLDKPIHFYIFDTLNKAIYSQPASANMLNHLKMEFCLGRNNDVIVSSKNIPIISNFLMEIGTKIFSLTENPFELFLN